MKSYVHKWLTRLDRSSLNVRTKETVVVGYLGAHTQKKTNQTAREGIFGYQNHHGKLSFGDRCKSI